MRLGIIIVVLVCAEVSPVVSTSPPVLIPSKPPPQCTGTTFIPVTCMDESVVRVFSGTNGAHGKHGKVGLPGPRGVKGENAVMCNNKRTKIKCGSMYENYLKEIHEVRWIDDFLDYLLGYDLGELTKMEMVEWILTQNKKIIHYTSEIEQLDGKVDELTKEVQKHLDKKNYQNDDPNQGNGRSMEGNRDKEVNALEQKVTELKEQVKVCHRSSRMLAAAKTRMKTIEVQLKTKSAQLVKNIAFLKRGIKAKAEENKDLLKKLTTSTSVANNNAKAFKAIMTQNDNLKIAKAEAEERDRITMLEKKAEMQVMAKELAALKIHCKDVDNQKLIIAQLRKQIQEVGKVAPVIKPAVQPVPEVPAPIQPRTTAIFGSTDTSKPITSISGEDIGHFSGHLRSGKIVLQSQMGNDKSGPYIILLRRSDGSQDFKKSFAEYKKGFGNSEEFWIGLDILHDLTKSRQYELKVQLTDHKNKKFWARYGKFSVGPGPEYRLNVGDFTGNTYNALKYHNRQKFSTFDKDQDSTSTRSCAEGTGGWWYKRCHLALLTGNYNKEVKEDKNGVRWYDRRVHGRYYSWKKAVMLVKPVVLLKL